MSLLNVILNGCSNIAAFYSALINLVIFNLQDGFQLQELACPKNEAVPFDFQLLERKAKASCGIGNQVNAPWLD